MEKHDGNINVSLMYVVQCKTLIIFRGKDRKVNKQHNRIQMRLVYLYLEFLGLAVSMFDSEVLTRGPSGLLAAHASQMPSAQCPPPTRPLRGSVFPQAGHTDMFSGSAWLQELG